MSDEQRRPEHLSDHLKDFTHEVEQQFSHIEQQPPNKPSFLLVVLLSGVVIIILLILAIFVLHLGGGKYGSHSFRHHPTSRLVLPRSGAELPMRINA